MAGGVERDSHPADRGRLAVTGPYDVRVRIHPGMEDVQALVSREIMPATPARVIGVRVRNDGAVDGPPWVDIKTTGFAVEPVFGRPQQRCRGTHSPFCR